MWFHHPLPTILLGIFVFITILVSTIKLDIDRFPNLELHRWRSIQANTLFIYAIAGFLWSTYTAIFYRGIRTLGAMLGLRQRGVTATVTQGDLFTLHHAFGMTWYDIVLFALRRRGSLVWIGALAGAGILIAVFSRRKYSFRLPLLVVIVTIFAGMLGTADFIFTLAPNIQFGRFIRPATALAPITAGIVVLAVLSFARTRVEQRSSVLVICLVLVIVLGTGIGLQAATTYKSPWILQNNNHIVESNIDGMEWYFEMKDRDINTRVLWRTHKRYAQLLLTDQEAARREAELQLAETNTSKYRVPPHFGRPHNLGSVIGEAYYVESTSQRKLHLVVFEELNRFNEDDFSYLTHDSSVNRIYSNGNVNVSIVSSRRSQ
jgi:hypothetical protein